MLLTAAPRLSDVASVHGRWGARLLGAVLGAAGEPAPRP